MALVNNTQELRELGTRAMRFGTRLVQHATRGMLIEGLPGHMRDFGRDALAAQLSVGWAAEWARLAFPTIQTGHKHAAALMSTSIPNDTDIRLPWPVCLMEVPAGLVSILDSKGEAQTIERVMVTCLNGDRWTYVALAGPVELTQNQRSLEYLRTGELDSSEPVGAYWGAAFDTQDERAMRCIARYILNACVVMSDPDVIRPVGKAREMRTGGVTQTARTYDISRPVSVDCREQVRDYVMGRRYTAPTARWLVRGHFREQPHGPERSLRRRQWIEPFWKGIEGTPAVVRPHVIRGPHDGH